MLPVEDMRSSGNRGAIGAGVTLLGFLLNTLPAHAQADEATTRASARQLGTAGVEAYQAGSYAKASEKLEKAFRILKAPTLGLWSARALKATGNYVQAAERYLDVTRLEASGGDIAVQKRAIVEALEELESLRPKIPSLTIELKGAAAADVSVELDGVVISSDLLGERQPVNPGRHSIVIRRGDEQATAQVSLSEGESKTTVLQLKPAEPGASGAPAPVRDAPASALPASTASPAADSAPNHKASSTRTLGWISLGVGGAGLALGSVSGILALGKRSSIDDSEQCDGDQCYAPERELAESYNSLRTWSSVGFIAGGALAATGVVLLLTSPSSTQASTGRGPSAALSISPQGAVVKGRF